MIQIRKVEEDDEMFVYKLALDFPSPTEIDGASFSETWIEKLGDENSFTCVAELAGKIIGYAAGYQHRAFYANGSTFWVDEVLVQEGFRKDGVGTKLMSEIDRWAKERGCKQILLASSQMGEFYDRLRFKNTAGYFKKYL